VFYLAGKAITKTYDAAGNTEGIDAAGSLTAYSWDIENRMTLAELPDATLNTMTYDGDGKRRQYEDSAGLRKFVWDGENILLQTDSGGTTNRDYTYNPQLYGELVSQSGLFHLYDGLGSTDMLTDADRDQVVSYLYKAFGEQTITYGSDPNRFTWIGSLGYYRQPDTDDYWVRARVYRPTVGRWVSRDPIGEGANWYAYVGDNPVVLVDPEGLARGWAFAKCMASEMTGIPRSWVEAGAARLGIPRTRPRPGRGRECRRPPRAPYRAARIAERRYNRAAERAFRHPAFWARQGRLMRDVKRYAWAAARASARVARTVGRVSLGVNIVLGAYSAHKCAKE